MRIELKGVRMQSWGGQIWNVKGFEGGDPSYSAHFIFAKDHKDRVTGKLTVDMIEAAMLDAAKEKFGAKAEATLKSARLSNKIPYHDGDGKPESDGYAGNLYLSARSPGNKPGPAVLHRLKNADGSPWNLTQDEGILYDGCLVDVIVDIYGYDKGSNGITAGLKGVRFYKQSDAFGNGAPITDSAFSELAADDIEL